MIPNMFFFRNVDTKTDSVHIHIKKEKILGTRVIISNTNKGFTSAMTIYALKMIFSIQQEN